MPTIELAGVTKVYPDGHLALEPFDLCIADGELCVLVGPSGCGKTTVLRIVAGLERVSSGEVRFDGEDVTGQGPRERGVSMAFQEGALYPHMTVGENLSFPLRIAGLRRSVIDRAVDDVARTLGLADVLDQRPSRLSGGQRQRVSLGRTVIRGPSVMLMDEPMSNLDAKLRADGRATIVRLHRRLEATTVYVTHDQIEAMAMADRVVVMRDGRVRQIGPPVEVYDRPAELFVARFVGSPPMSVVAGTIVGDPDAVAGRALLIGAHRVLLDERFVARFDLARLPYGRVAIGARADAFQSHPDGALRAEVSSTEHHGSVQLVHATIEAEAVDHPDAPVAVDVGRVGIVVEFPTSTVVDRWRPLRLCVDPAALHLYDPTTGASLR